MILLFQWLFLFYMYPILPFFLRLRSGLYILKICFVYFLLRISYCISFTVYESDGFQSFFGSLCLTMNCLEHGFIFSLRFWYLVVLFAMSKIILRNILYFLFHSLFKGEVFKFQGEGLFGCFNYCYCFCAGSRTDIRPCYVDVWGIYSFYLLFLSCVDGKGLPEVQCLPDCGSVLLEGLKCSHEPGRINGFGLGTNLTSYSK